MKRQRTQRVSKCSFGETNADIQRYETAKSSEVTYQ